MISQSIHPLKMESHKERGYRLYWRRICIHGATNRRSKWRALMGKYKRFIPLCLTIGLIIVYHIGISIDPIEEIEQEGLVYAKLSKRNLLDVPDVLSFNDEDFLSGGTKNFKPLPNSVLRRRGPPPVSVSCPALFKGDRKEVQKAKDYMASHERTSIQDTDYIAMAQDCDNFKQSRGYFSEPLSKEEADFPIAFSILMYKQLEQVERLLRAVYMPQNYYCIHIDTKAPRSVHLSVRALAKCFPNVFVASKLESVYWGHISILQAEMNCLHDLMKYQWNYYINLSGQMFPLQTNAHLVKILKLYNGANDVEGTLQRSRHFWMFWRLAVRWKLVRWLGGPVMTMVPKGAPPHNVTIYKGSNQVAASRDFVEFALYNQKARDLYEWLKDTSAPDEHFLPSLNHNLHLHAPGAYTGNPERKVFTARATIWTKVDDQINWSWDDWACQGQWVRHICILGVGDLPWTQYRPELFVNKLFVDYEPLTYDCLEELMYNRTLAGRNYTFDAKYYEHMDIVKHRENVLLPTPPGS